MSQAQIKKAVRYIKNFLRQRGIGAERVVLFGSYAKNSAAGDSDVDIAIVSDDFSGKDIFQRSRMIRGLNWSLTEKFAMPFDLVPLSSAEWDQSSSLVVDFAKQGRVYL